MSELKMSELESMLLFVPLFILICGVANLCVGNWGPGIVLTIVGGVLTYILMKLLGKI